ncbi:MULTISPECIES: two-component regulator propeller domain-containing protein [unclassified Bacteroides]|uniref:hybrid sensor histidine kinase/response regulator transcription factor n=1 Tax=unclassified Bacteroides TaxID=2646097 RepID=UPI0001DAA58F|nr:MULTISPECIES: two-component regulator propeller domain-containing protein [unclassified Bacteroides]EFI39290.1 putative two-component system sensor histidine kinase/response [Bacteroides sp. 3_1_23]RGD49707.1 hybrid sensor histidine kinase/response regulator [Bacteroides sp. AM16-13]RJX14467.1 hybrid sensor histidine kinase/response regulator [Bacteroides sp. OF03-11BH]
MIRKNLLLFVLLLSSWMVVAQSYQFKHLEVSDGLSNNSVNTICKDRDGFMWFGTTTGLNRYDGYTFKIYQHAENDPGSLPDNYITDIVEMPDGRFWVNTGRGYVLFDKEQDCFITDVTGFMKNLESGGVPEQVFVDREGNTCLSVAGEGCYRYKEGGKRLFFSYVEHSLPEHGVTQIAECSDGLLLIYNTGLLVCLDRATLAIKWKSDEIKKYIPAGKTIEFSLFVDRDNCIWAYSLMGIWAYDCGTKSWRTDLTAIWSSRPDVIIHAVAQDIEGRIWVGKDYDGIDVLEKETGKVTSLVAHDDNGRSLPHNTIYDLYADRDGIMWVGTYKKGVSYYSESIFKFNMYEWGDITCIEQADENRLWLGTNDHGILLWNRSTGKAEPFWRDAEGQLPNPVVSMLKSKDGKLWVGTFNGGLYCMNGSQIRSYKEGVGNALASNNVWALVEDDKGRIWIASLGGGLQCLEPVSGTFETYTSSNSALLENNVTSLCWVDNNTLFFGTANQGVGMMDMRTREIKKIQGQSGNVKLSNDAVNHVYKDSRGLVWIATREGLNVYDTRRHVFLGLSFVAEAKGNFIAAITEDQERNMWVSTSRKVIRVTVASDGKGSYLFDSRAYNSEDGLQNCDFNQRSIKTLHNGIIAIGGLYGVNVFAPDHIRYNKMLPNVMFTGLSLFDEAVKVGQSYGGRVLIEKELNDVENVEFDYKQNIFSVSFASDNYNLPEKTQYMYKLEGFNNDWLTLPLGVHNVTFTNLAPGKYVLRVKAINSDGYVGIKEATLGIVVNPPFWMSWWAYLLYTVGLVIVLFLARYRMLKREREKFHLQQIENEVAKNEEINNMKFRFFTNVSHELRTPLTLIISPLEGMLKETTDELQSTRLQLMYRNAQRLLHLVNQLLDFRKGEMSTHQLSLSEGDIISYVHSVCNSFLLMADKKHIQFSFFSGIDTFSMAFDADKVGKIVMNLLSNAFKFTPEGGRVTVMIEHVAGTPDILEIKIADTGIGISDVDKEHIFERFYQAGHKGVEETTGNGIGLSLVRDFVTLHEGEVKVFDNIGMGSVFVIQFPVKHVETQVQLPEETGMSAGDEEDKEMKEEAREETERKNFPLLLIVDDNEDFRIFMRYSLELQYRVKLAVNGKEAWEMMQEELPDLVISDVMMPQMDGNELCRLIKQDKRTAHIPVILLTARQNTEAKLEGLQTGADDYVTKPFNMTILVLRIRKLIELSRYHRVTQGMIDPAPSEIVITSLDEKLIEKAIKYVEDNMSRTELSVEELSRELGMSRVHLYKKLLQITGKTPIEFIRVIRLKRAAQLLRESQLHVSEVAFEVGFNNPKYFSRYFKDEFGVLPSVYQEKEGK